jgi:hypothetical protein
MMTLRTTLYASLADFAWNYRGFPVIGLRMSRDWDYTGRFRAI